MFNTRRIFSTLICIIYISRHDGLLCVLQSIRARAHNDLRPKRFHIPYLISLYTLNLIIAQRTLHSQHSHTRAGDNITGPNFHRERV